MPLMRILYIRQEKRSSRVSYSSFPLRCASFFPPLFLDFFILQQDLQRRIIQKKVLPHFVHYSYQRKDANSVYTQIAEEISVDVKKKENKIQRGCFVLKVSQKF